MFKLGVKVPEPYLCVQYMKEIAAENNVKWDDSSMMHTVETPTGLNPQQSNMNLQPSFQMNPYQQQQQQQNVQMNPYQQQQQSTYTPNEFESKLDPLQYINDLKKKQNQVKSTGYQVNFNPESDPNQIPDFITSGNPNLFVNEPSPFNQEELYQQQLQLKELMRKQQEMDDLKKLQLQQKQSTHDFFKPEAKQTQFTDFEELKNQLQDQNRQSMSNLTKKDLGYNPSQSMIDFEKEMNGLGVNTKTTVTSNNLLDFENEFSQLNNQPQQNFQSNPFDDIIPETKPFVKPTVQQPKTEEPKFVDEFSGFDDGMDFDDLQARFESLKNRE
jgi:hypothetical protein